MADREKNAKEKDLNSKVKKFIMGCTVATTLLIAASYYPEIEDTIRQTTQEVEYDSYFFRQERELKKRIQTDYKEHTAAYQQQEAAFEQRLKEEPDLVIELSRSQMCIACDELRKRLDGENIHRAEFITNDYSNRMSEILYLRGDLPVPIFATPVIVIYKDGKATGAYIGYSQRDNTVTELTRLYPVREKERGLEDILNENPHLKK